MYFINSNKKRDQYKHSFCDCWKTKPELWKGSDICHCGEDAGMINGKKLIQWLWEPPIKKPTGNVILSEDRKQFTYQSSINLYDDRSSYIIKGDIPFVHDYHYYWEVKLLSETADNLMIGLGTKEVMKDDSREWVSRLGCSKESYGLNFMGEAYHRNFKNLKSTFDGFCRGCIVGVKLDMWAGTIEYYINREPQGIQFRGLRRHKELYPMISTNGENIGVRLIYASSYKASLFVEASKILGIFLKDEDKAHVFPAGFHETMDSMFWLLLPSDVDETDADWYNFLNLSQCKNTDRYHYFPISAILDRRPRQHKFF